jgi:SAM-dependent methyltransferase
MVGLSVSRVNKPMTDEEKRYRELYDQNFEKLTQNHRQFTVYKEYRYDIEPDHRKIQPDYEFEFAAHHIRKETPDNILDIGSYRHFILGLLAHYNVTTVDIRAIEASLENQTIVTCDAKKLPFPSDSFGAVITMGTLPHIGMGRYRDELDLDADLNAFNEMRRVLKPGGIIIFTIAMVGGKPTLAWNARRNYSYEMMREFCAGLELVDEKFFDRKALRHCTRAELTTEPGRFDYYFGCWRKRQEDTDGVARP